MEIESPKGSLYKIKEEQQTRTNITTGRFGKEFVESLLPYYAFNVYEYLAGVCVYRVKAFRIGHIDSPYYQSEK